MAEKSPQNPKRGVARGIAKRTSVVAEAIAERRKARVKTDEVRIWDERIALSLRESSHYYEQWQRNLLYYVGQQEGYYNEKEAIRLRQSLLIVNRLMPALAAQNARLMPRIPWFRMEPDAPVGDNDESKLEALESATNFILRLPRAMFLQNIRLMILGAHLGIGCLKATYTPDEGKDPEEGKKPQYGELTVDEDPLTGGISADIQGGEPLLDDDGNLQVRAGNKVLLDTRNPADYFHLDWVDWRDLRFDPEGGNNVYQHRWHAQRINWPVDEFKANPLFDSSLRADAVELAQHIANDVWREKRLGGLGNQKVRQSYTEGTMAPDEADMLRVWGYQIWDAKNLEVIYHVDGADKLAGKYAYPGWCENIIYPYSWLKFHEVPGESWPYTETEAAIPLARSYNISRSQKMNHVRRYNRKYISRKKALDAANKEMLKDPEDGIVIEATDPNSIKPLEDAPLDPSIYNDMDRDIFDFSEIMSSPPEARGIAQSGSATQAAIVERRSTSREDDKRLLVATAIEIAVDALKECLQANLDSSMAVRIAGPQGTIFQGHVGRPEIAISATPHVEMSEMEPYDESQERVAYAGLLQQIGPELAFQSPEFSKEFFRVWMPHNKKVAAELTKIVTQVATQPAVAPPEAAGGGGTSPGGYKPPGQGPEQGNTTEGRSQGRTLRTLGGSVPGPDLGPQKAVG